MALRLMDPQTVILVLRVAGQGVPPKFVKPLPHMHNKNKRECRYADLELRHRKSWIRSEDKLRRKKKKQRTELCKKRIKEAVMNLRILVMEYLRIENLS